GETPPLEELVQAPESAHASPLAEHPAAADRDVARPGGEAVELVLQSRRTPGHPAYQAPDQQRHAAKSERRDELCCHLRTHAVASYQTRPAEKMSAGRNVPVAS